MILIHFKEDIHQLHQILNLLDMKELELCKVYLVILNLEELERNLLKYLFHIHIDNLLVRIMVYNVLLHHLFIHQDMDLELQLMI